jgi:hypothetical protein
MRLFGEGDSPLPLKLMSSDELSTGVLDLVYAPDPSSAATASAEAAESGEPVG